MNQLDTFVENIDIVYFKENEIVQKWLEGKVPKKIIYVKNKMINVVI